MHVSVKYIYPLSDPNDDTNRVANAVPFVDDEQIDLPERFRNRRPDLSVLASKNLSSDFYNFLDGLLDRDPKKRMTCSQALHHPWLEQRKDVQARIQQSDEEAMSSGPSRPLGHNGDISMMANAGSYLDAEEAAAAAAQSQLVQPSLGIATDFDQIRVNEVSPDTVTPILPPGPSPPRATNKLERRPMELWKEDDNLGSYQYVTEDMLDEASPDANNGGGASTLKGTLKRKDRSESMEEDYEMGRASDAGSDNSMATTPVPGGSNDAQTPTEERNQRPRGGNKRSKGC